MTKACEHYPHILMVLLDYLVNWNHKKKKACLSHKQSHTLINKDLHTILLIHFSAIDHAQTGHGVPWAADGRHMCVVTTRALWGAFKDHATATTQLLVELLLESLAQQVKGEGVEAGVGERQDTSYNAAYKVKKGSVHLAGERDRVEKMFYYKMERQIECE